MKIFFLINAICFLSLLAQAQNIFPTPSGSVGIGTISPSALLHVHNPNNLGTSSGSTIELARFSGVNTNISQLRFQLNRYASGNDWYSASMRLQHVIDYTNAGYIEFDPINGNMGVAIGSGNNEIMRFVSSGNVGIGTTNPKNKLQIADGADDATPYGSVQIIRPANPGDNRFHLSFIRNGQMVSGIGYVSGTNTLGIWAGVNTTNTQPLITFLQTQSVGIGTSTPPAGYLLAVAGKMIATGVTVKQQASWPDYVFEPAYQLPSLQSVENFITVNKHLPEVPSAEAVKKDGVDLGNNQTVLLKKIEELTLYLIEQNKKIEAQDTLIQKLMEEQQKLQEQNNTMLLLIKK